MVRGKTWDPKQCPFSAILIFQYSHTYLKNEDISLYPAGENLLLLTVMQMWEWTATSVCEMKKTISSTFYKYGVET